MNPCNSISESRKHRFYGIFSVLLGSILIGFSLLAVDEGLKFVNPYQLLSDRLLITLLVLWILRATRIVKIRKVAFSDRLLLLALSCLFPTFFFLFQIWGITKIPVSQASIIYSLMPLITLALSRLMLKEKSPLWELIGSVLSVLGVVYITCYSLTLTVQNPWGYLWVFLSVFCFSLYLVVLKSIVGRINSITITYYVLVYSAIMVNICYWIYCLKAHGSIKSLHCFFNGEYLEAILFLSLFCTLFTSFCTNFGAKYLSPALVSVFSNLSPIIGLFLALVLLKQQPICAFHVIGSAIVLAGIILGSLKK